jgi:hypothetical protein
MLERQTVRTSSYCICANAERMVSRPQLIEELLAPAVYCLASWLTSGNMNMNAPRGTKVLLWWEMHFLTCEQKK